MSKRICLILFVCTMALAITLFASVAIGNTLSRTLGARALGDPIDDPKPNLFGDPIDDPKPNLFGDPIDDPKPNLK